MTYTVETEQFSDDITINIVIDEDCANPWEDSLSGGTKGAELVGNDTSYLYGDQDRYAVLDAAKYLANGVSAQELFETNPPTQSIKYLEEHERLEAIELSKTHLIVRDYTRSSQYIMALPASVFPKDQETPEQALGYLKGCMEAWINWCEGCCYGFTLSTSKDVDGYDNACWGFIGDSNYCMSEAREAAKCLQIQIDKAKAIEAREACARASVRSLARACNPIFCE